jgi:hypothetical protein
MTPAPQHPVQSRWIVYDNWEHEFSVYYNEQEAKKEYEARIRQINDDVGTDEYEGEEEVYLARVLEKAEVVQTGVTLDGDEGLYRLVSYDCSPASASSDVLEELEKWLTDKIECEQSSRTTREANRFNLTRMVLRKYKEEFRQQTKEQMMRTKEREQG